MSLRWQDWVWLDHWGQELLCYTKVSIPTAGVRVMKGKLLMFKWLFTTAIGSSQSRGSQPWNTAREGAFPLLRYQRFPVNIQTKTIIVTLYIRVLFIVHLLYVIKDNSYFWSRLLSNGQDIQILETHCKCEPTLTKLASLQEMKIFKTRVISHPI